MNDKDSAIVQFVAENNRVGLEALKLMADTAMQMMHIGLAHNTAERQRDREHEEKMARLKT